MKTTIAVTFFMRKARVNKAGLAPVYMRIYVGDQRLNIMTKILVRPEEWSGAHGKLKPNTEEAKKTNHHLDSFKIRAFDCQRELMNEGKDITMENMHAKWCGVSLERPRMLMEIYAQHTSR